MRLYILEGKVLDGTHKEPETDDSLAVFHASHWISHHMQQAS